MNELDALYAKAEKATKELEEKTSPNSTTYKRDERIMDTKGTRTIYFRMFPDMVSENVKFDLPYNINIIKSVVTGKNIYAGTNPSYVGRDDFWKEKQLDLWDQDQMDKAKLLYPTPRKVVNVYIIKDTGDEENNGKFKVYAYNNKPVDPKRPKAGSPIPKGIDRFLKRMEEEWDDKKGKNPFNFPMKNFYSLGEDGVTFRMEIVESQNKNEFADVTVSVIKAGEPVAGFVGLPQDSLLKVYKKKGYALEEFVDEPKSDEELEKIYKRHVLGISSNSNSNYFDGVDDDEDGEVSSNPVTDSSVDSVLSELENASSSSNDPIESDSDDTDEEIRKLLAEM